MTRLTNKQRDEIIDKIKAETIKPRHEKLKEKLSKACQKAADKLHSPKVKKWLDEAPEEMKGQFTYASGCYPRINDNKYFADGLNPDSVNGYGDRFKVSLVNPVVNPDRYRNFELVITNGEKLQAEFDALLGDWTQLKSTLTQALHACTTHKQLTEKYPDLAKHLPKPEPQVKALTVTEDKVKKAIICAKSGKCQ